MIAPQRLFSLLPARASALALPPRWSQRIRWGLMAVGVSWLLGWLVLPGWLKPTVERLASEALGRKVEVQALGFHPWSLGLTLEGLTIATADGQGTQLAVERVEVDAELESLFRLAPVVDELHIEHPELRLSIDADGRPDVQDVIDRLNDTPASPEPTRFALYNIQVNDGQLTLHDGPRGQSHEVTQLRVHVPFVSTLKNPRQVKVQPHLAFVLDGSRFDTDISTQPFSAPLNTEAQMTFEGLDLAPYLALWPTNQPLRPTAAVLSGQLKLNFSQQSEPHVQLSGQLEATQVQVVDAQRQTALTLARAQVALDDVRPLRQVFHLGAVTLSQPRVFAHRLSAGQVNLWPAPSAAAPNPEAAAPDLRVARVQLDDGRIEWVDDATPDAQQRPTRLSLDDLNLQLQQVQFPLPKADAPSTLALNARWTHGKAAAPLKVTGQIDTRGAQLNVDLQGVALDGLSPYIATQLKPRLSGQVNLSAQALWAPATVPGEADTLTLTLKHLSADALRLSHGSTTLASLQRLDLSDLTLNPTRRTLEVGQLSLTRPAIQMGRNRDGLLNATEWRVPTAAPTEAEANAEVVPAPQAAWRWRIADLNLSGGQLTWQDTATPQPVNVQVQDLQWQAQSLASDGDTPAAVSLDAKVSSGHTEPGRLTWKGQLRLAADGTPAQAQGQVTARRLPAHAAAPYVADALNLSLGRADTSFVGQFDYQPTPDGPRVTVKGDVTLEDLRADTLADAGRPADELLHWKSLNLRGLDLQTAPGQRPRVAIQSGALNDFFARVVVQESGRINLQDLVRTPAAAAPAPTAAQPSTPSTHGPGWQVSVGPFSLVQGRVAFADHFIQPNYQADLSELTGRIGGFSSDNPKGSAPQMADVELRGRAEGTASLAITGKLNPLAQPLALDIEGKVRDLELSPLSPYSVKYTGHGIQRGKLSVDVAYTVQPDGQLTARNQLVLHQLTFGEAVPGAPASLPVKLATALLADGQGVIDLNLPISGSLNDPQFSLVPVFFKVLGNLVVKAITSPFTLLTHAFGGDADQLSSVGFAPGTAQLDAESADKLTRVAQLLADKPSLTLTITGAADLATERTAYQKARLASLVLAEMRPQPADTPTDAAPSLSPEDHQRGMVTLYKRADMPKPRNALGLLKDIAPADMETLLMTQIPATDTQMNALAVQRGVAVRDHLARLGVAPQRLFLGTPPVGATAPAQAHLQLALP
ncbi:MAG TPA: DUF748 domain-containing protein [Burkholderiaceae bacterium]|nr:DUF748 domain-containing protein [Burkholderiaceae bacterium]